ncbi:DUF6152 family protein [Falsiroseomonas sp. HC035]|uniref:DUF6152 family protein n=1 Tax=Falsiroseomonas sp. HC035 TaxID=3390999 RepID=UPI003D312D70
MQRHTHGRRAALGFLAATVTAGGAAAHHGWSWAEGDQGELTGTIREIYIGAPHPTLRVEANGQLWIVELGNPRQTAAAGFNAESARAGDEVRALGNSSRSSDERRMKAVRVTVRERTYDIYPERIRS